MLPNRQHPPPLCLTHGTLVSVSIHLRPHDPFLLNTQENIMKKSEVICFIHHNLMQSRACLKKVYSQTDYVVEEF